LTSSTWKEATAAEEAVQQRDLEIERLLLRYQQGDTAAAASLVRAVSPGFFAYCVNRGDSPADAEDAVQEIWLRVHRARHTFRPGAPAAPWLYAIARHARLDARRRRERFRARELQTDSLAEFPGPKPEAPAEMSRILACLPDSQREVLVLLKGCGMTLEEVARATASTVGAVKQKAHRAYRKLRATIEEMRRPL
jgi:RNA polymerase sigma-70 factor, ECF subfamily